MIVQCRQCRTKFRFDDSQIVGDGIWVRCSRCQHVFFQDNPKKLNLTADVPQAGRIHSESGPAEKTVSRLTFEPASPAPGGSAHDDDVASFLEDVMAAPTPSPGQTSSKLRSAEKREVDLPDIEFSSDFEDLEEAQEFEESPAESPVAAHKKPRVLTIVLWTILVIVGIPAFIYFVIFPQLGERYVQLGERGLQGALNTIGVSRSAVSQPVMGQIKLQDIRQRVVNNYVLGNIRIVEGYAVNQADFSVSRIMVKGEILDPYAVVLGERTAYAGNVLTDEDLTNLSEEEIFKKLAVTSGRDNSNERVIPNGRIPFMIVFTREPPGVIKTTVTVAGAERLL